MKEERRRPAGSEEPSRLTASSSLIGRPARAWMTTKRGRAEMTRGQDGHATTWLPTRNHHPHRRPSLPKNPTGHSICSCCSSALIKESWLGRRHQKHAQTRQVPSPAKMSRMHLAHPVGKHPTPKGPQVLASLRARQTLQRSLVKCLQGS